MERQRKKQPEWDVHYSTYYWEIYLDPMSEHNSALVKCLTGYSKKEGQSEARDIHYLLKAKLMNLNKNGYFERILYIKIFQRTGEMINKRFDPCILMVYPKHYVIPDDNHDLIYKRFARFLDELYRRKKDNLSLEGLLPRLREKWSKDDLINITFMSKYINNFQQLYTHAGKLLIHGHPEGAVENFIRTMKQLKGFV